MGSSGVWTGILQLISLSLLSFIKEFIYYAKLFASCSEDQMVHIWDEQECVSAVRNENRERWQRKAQLGDSKKSVKDVKFAPRHQGIESVNLFSFDILRFVKA